MWLTNHDKTYYNGMSTTQTVANKSQHYRNSRFTSRTKPRSKQDNYKTIKKNQFKKQNIIEM